MNLSLSNAKTMSSRDIATLTHCAHKTVLRSIERLASSGVLTAPLVPSKYRLRGKDYKEYLLNKIDSMVVVAQLSPAFMAAVVIRWQELEEELAAPPVPALPGDFVEALRMLADTSEKNAELEAQKLLDAPKVDFVDSFVDSEGCFGLRDTANTLGFKPKAFNELLRDRGFLYYLDGVLTAKAVHIEKGLFRQVVGEGPNGHAYRQTKVTTAGLAHFARILATELME